MDFARNAGRKPVFGLASGSTKKEDHLRRDVLKKMPKIAEFVSDYLPVHQKYSSLSRIASKQENSANSLLFLNEALLLKPVLESAYVDAIAIRLQKSSGAGADKYSLGVAKELAAQDFRSQMISIAFDVLGKPVGKDINSYVFTEIFRGIF